MAEERQHGVVKVSRHLTHTFTKDLSSVFPTPSYLPEH